MTSFASVHEDELNLNFTVDHLFFLQRFRCLDRRSLSCRSWSNGFCYLCVSRSRISNDGSRCDSLHSSSTSRKCSNEQTNRRFVENFEDKNSIEMNCFHLAVGEYERFIKPKRRVFTDWFVDRCFHLENSSNSIRFQCRFNRRIND